MNINEYMRCILAAVERAESTSSSISFIQCSSLNRHEMKCGVSLFLRQAKNEKFSTKKSKETDSVPGPGQQRKRVRPHQEKYSLVV